MLEGCSPQLSLVFLTSSRSRLVFVFLVFFSDAFVVHAWSVAHSTPFFVSVLVLSPFVVFILVVIHSRAPNVNDESPDVLRDLLNDSGRLNPMDDVLTSELCVVTPDYFCLLHSNAFLQLLLTLGTWGKWGT